MRRGNDIADLLHPEDIFAMVLKDKENVRGCFA
jgi:hypothetical protein